MSVNFTLGGLPEAEERERNWRTCAKNPGHVEFLPAPDFVNEYVPRIHDERQRNELRSYLDLTVRLRVLYTSEARPDGGDFSDHRGTNKLRVGTGFIDLVWAPAYLGPCACHGRTQWEFNVRTALHVIFNTEEALHSKVDLFYDDTQSQTDGRMKSVSGVEVLDSKPDRDVCAMRCVTCDEDLGQRIESAWRNHDDTDVELTRKVLDDMGLLQSCSKDYDTVLIVSHPHAQPKQVTVGELRHEKDENDLSQYTTPTCPGSSGAPVFLLDKVECHYWFTSVHNGSCGETCPDKLSFLKRCFNKLMGHKPQVKQLNYGHRGWW